MYDSPLVQLLRKLITLQQHQQEAQAEDRRAIRELLAAIADRQPTSTPPPPVHLAKMSPEDDPGAFLDIFERTALACRWPETEWVLRLTPLLTGEALVVAKQIPVTADYGALRTAIMKRVGLTAEGHRKKLRSLRYEDVGGPLAFAQQLQDSCIQWLQPETESERKIVELVTLEQFVTALPEKTSTWIRCYQPASLSEAVQLAENHLTVAMDPGSLVLDQFRALSIQFAQPPHPLPAQNQPQAAVRPPEAPSPDKKEAFLSPSATSFTCPQEIPQSVGRWRSKCWHCGKLGHWRRDCPEMVLSSSSPVVDPSRYDTSGQANTGGFRRWRRALREVRRC